jgi:hypothetical protein
MLRGALSLAGRDDFRLLTQSVTCKRIRRSNHHKAPKRILHSRMRSLNQTHQCRLQQDTDPADATTSLIATSLRRSALLGLRRSDYNEAAGTSHAMDFIRAMRPNWGGKAKAWDSDCRWLKLRRSIVKISAAVQIDWVT